MKHNWQPHDWMPATPLMPPKDVYKCTKCLQELSLNQHKKLPDTDDCPGSADVTQSDIKALHEMLDKTPLVLGGDEGNYAEYIDEADGRGVQICDKNGRVLVQMPTTVWDELQEHIRSSR